jgi:hypothetical protein
VKVEDTPWQFNLGSKHAILILREDASMIKLSLKMKGIISYLITRQTTSEEIKNCERLELTSDKEWEPYSGVFAATEEGLSVPDDDDLTLPTSNRRTATTRSEIVHGNDDDRPPVLQDRTNYVTESDDISDDDDEGGNCGRELMSDDDSLFYRRLSSAVRVRLSIATTSGERQPPISADDLSKKWGISLKAAVDTIKVTTQRGIRYSVGPLH